MDVTDVLRDRMQEPGGAGTMATSLSVAAHAVFAAIVLLAPGMWGNRSAEVPKTVMTISLGGGASGSETAGLTPESGKPIQAVKPPEEAAKPEALRPPAAKTPAMTLPEKNAKPLKPTAPVKEAPDDARGRTPTRGAETRPGTAAADTGIRGQGFGLSSGHGAGSGSFLDVSDFCCPDYIALMSERIRSHWTPQADSAGEVLVAFTIQRDGRITGPVLERSSGNPILDLSAQRALFTTRQLPALPAAFPNPTLTVHLNFQYEK
jgi:TonB family protein